MGMDLGNFLQLMQKVYELERAGGSDPSAAVPYGAQGYMTLSQYRNSRKAGNFARVRVKEATLVQQHASDTLYGCRGLFSLCGPDDIIGLSMLDDPLIPWLGFFPDAICEKSIKGWVYTDVQGTAAGSPTGTAAGSACDDPPVTEKGICEFFIGEHGTYRMCGEPVDASAIGVRKCDKTPTYSLPIEGVGQIVIDNDLELETLAAAQGLKHAVSRAMILGDKNTPYEFDGLQNLVKQGYVSIQGERCYSMDSWFLDWDNDDLDGLVNGRGSIINAVRAAWRSIRWRIQQTNMGAPREGDVVLVMPSWLAWKFMDAWAYWSIYEGRENNPVYRDSLALREFVGRYSQGLFGSGFITIDGFNIHILEHNWLPISEDDGNFCADIYMLTRTIGSRRVLQGQYVPVENGAAAVNAAAGYSYFGTESIQGGRAMRWLKTGNGCVQPCLLMRPRIYLETPWAQARIANVCVPVEGGAFSPDPQSQFFFEQNKVVATTPTGYWYGDDGWFH